ncbi:hypothetical protein E2C01_038414 [Portunus trituberculatus]|uniref:Uncharacterized protein n=1 Tax=Portunus trituberculatus TaxID=210409 RepID=A0A5B7FGQ1_PORTR|nr:hypothetical protein [Portunus trituberculatus]
MQQGGRVVERGGVKGDEKFLGSGEGSVRLKCELSGVLASPRCQHGAAEDCRGLVVENKAGQASGGASEARAGLTAPYTMAAIVVTGHRRRHVPGGSWMTTVGVAPPCSLPVREDVDVDERERVT